MKKNIFKIFKISLFGIFQNQHEDLRLCNKILTLIMILEVKLLVLIYFLFFLMQGRPNVLLVLACPIGLGLMCKEGCLLFPCI